MGATGGVLKGFCACFNKDASGAGSSRQDNGGLRQQANDDDCFLNLQTENHIFCWLLLEQQLATHRVGKRQTKGQVTGKGIHN